MTKRDFEAIAKVLANGFRASRNLSGEQGWEMFYENTYLPMVDYLKSDNPRFDQTLFSYRVATLANED